MLLFGGRSAEHDVSCVTAVAVAARARSRAYDVVPVGITTEGRWLLAADAQRAARKGPRRAARRVRGRRRTGAPADASPAAASRRRVRRRRSDVRCRRRAPAAARPVRRRRHGAGPARAGRPPVRRFGRARLRRRHGQGDDEARVRRARACRRRAYLALRDGHDVDAFVDVGRDELGLPVLREAGEHGLVGRRRRRRTTAASSRSRSRWRSTYDEWILAEEAIDGREIEVAVLGDDPPEASLPGRDRARRRVLRLRRQVRERRGAAARAGAARPTRRPPRCGRSRCGRSRRAAARRWRASTSSSRRPTAAASS